MGNNKKRYKQIDMNEKAYILRPSIVPFSQVTTNNKPNTSPAFIREKNLPSFVELQNDQYLASTHSHKINFQRLKDSNSSISPLALPQLLERYHDKSFYFKLFHLQPTIQFHEKVNHFYRLLFRQKGDDKQLIFKLNSNLLLFLNILMLIAIVFNLFQIPISIFFTSAVYNSQFDSAPGIVINAILILIFLINITIVKPNTEYYYLGYQVSQRKDIIRRYLKVRAMIDAISWLILLIYAVSNTYQLIYLKILFYVQIYTVVEIDSMIQIKIQLHPYTYAFYRLIKLMLFLLFIVTWLSCGFFYIDYELYRDNNTPQTQMWLTYSMCLFKVSPQNVITGLDIIQTYPWYVWLSYANYWALQTISTVGYGDITPRNPKSVTYTNFSILIMMFFFVYFINSIIQIIVDSTSSHQKFIQRNIKMLKITQNNLTKKYSDLYSKYKDEEGSNERNQDQTLIKLTKTTNKIRSYLSKMDSTQNDEDEDNIETIINDNLIDQLKEELFIQYRQVFFQKITIFAEIAKVSPHNYMTIFQSLIHQLKETYLAAQEIIFSQHSTSNHLYYLIKGQVSLQYKNSLYHRYLQNGLPIDHTQPNGRPINSHAINNFGMKQFFIGGRRDYSAATLTFCKIQLLEYAQFKKILKTNNSIHVRYCLLRDKILLNQQYKYTGQHCFECEENTHHLFICPSAAFNLSLLHKQNFIEAHLKAEEKEHRDSNFRLDHNFRVKAYQRPSIRSQKMKPHFVKKMKELFGSFKLIAGIQKHMNYEEYFKKFNLDQL